MTYLTSSLNDRADNIVKRGTEVKLPKFDLQPGQTIKWIGFGHRAKIEGVDGKEICGTVISVDKVHQEVSVMPNNRLSRKAQFYSQPANIAFEMITATQKMKDTNMPVLKNKTAATRKPKIEDVPTPRIKIKMSKKPTTRRPAKVEEVAVEKRKPTTRRPAKVVKETKPTGKTTIKPKAVKPVKEEKPEIKRLTSAAILRLHRNGERVPCNREVLETLINALIKAKAK